MVGPILRIPNFLIDPPYVEGPLTLVLCVSSPAAKEFFSVYDSSLEIIGQVQQAVAQGTEIHVFSDKVAYGNLQNRFGGGGQRWAPGHYLRPGKSDELRRRRLGAVRV